MLDKEHDEFLEALFVYHNARTAWNDNTIRANAIAVRKALKALIKISKTIHDSVNQEQWKIRVKNREEWEEKGYVQKGPKPRRQTTKDLKNE
jgi:hypothetical protein